MGGEFKWYSIHPWWIRVQNKCNPVIYSPLFHYDTGEILRDYVIESGGITTSPIPGIGKKTINFLANQDGFLTIDMCVHTRVEDMLPVWSPWKEALTVNANEVFTIEITEDAYAYRLYFEPDYYPCTINSANWFVREER